MVTVNVRKAPQPLRDAIFKEVEQRRSLYQERDAVMHNIRRYRLMRQDTVMPKAYQRKFGGSKGVKMPTMYRLVQTAVSAVAKRFPTVYVEPLSIGDRKTAAEMTRAAPLLLQAIERRAGRPFLYGLYFTLFGDGLGVTKTQPGAWSGFPLLGDDEDPAVYNERVQRFLMERPLPFQCRIVDPLTFYPPLNEYGEGVVIESAYRSTPEVLRSLNICPTSDGFAFEKVPEGKPYPDVEMPPGFPTSVRVDEVWSGSEVAVSIHGANETWVFENPTGEHPYNWGYADPTGVENPANVGMSVAYPLYYIAPWIDTMTGIMLAWAQLAAPTPYTTQDFGPGVRPTQETKIETFQLGKMYHFATGRKPGILSPPDVGAPVLNLLNFLNESADRGGLPALVSGGGVGTRLPSLTFQNAYEASTDRLRPGTQSLETIIAGTLHKAFNIIGHYDTPVKTNGWDYVAGNMDRKKRAWATIKPAEARKGRQIVVSLAIDSTQDKIAKGTHAQFMQAAGLYDVEEAMRFSGVENPEEMKDRVDADAVRRMMQPLIAEGLIMADPDMRALLEAKAEAEEEGGGGGSGGEPPGPGRNRKGVPAGRGGGKRGGPTQKPRGNRQGTGKSRGRT